MWLLFLSVACGAGVAPTPDLVPALEDATEDGYRGFEIA